MRCLARRFLAYLVLVVRVVAYEPSSASNRDVCVGSFSWSCAAPLDRAAGQSLLQLRRARETRQQLDWGGSGRLTSPPCVWGNYSDCTQRCGGGLKSRTRNCASGTELEVVACSLDACGPECELNPWLEWGQCSRKCGGGTQTRGRAVVVHPEHGGTNGSQCGKTFETIPCNVQDCPPEVVTTASTPSPEALASAATLPQSSLDAGTHARPREDGGASFGVGALAASLDPASDASAPNPHARHAQACPGGPVVVAADEGTCLRRGGNLMRNPDDDTDFQSLEDFFGDNKLMRAWKFILEDCVEDEYTGTCEIADTTDKRFKVGTTRVRVEGSDLAGNKNACLLSVHVVDTEPPSFGELSAVDEKLTLQVPDTACFVTAEYAFTAYAERGNAVVGRDNCDASVEIVKQITQDGYLIYDSQEDAIGPHNSEVKLGPGKYKMVFIAIDDYSSSVGVFHPGDLDLDVTPRNVTFSVDLVVEDKSAPLMIYECPRSTTVAIKNPNHTSAIVQWKLPYTRDNCEGSVPPVEQSVPQKYSGMHLSVGTHTVTYAFMDKAGNRMTQECEFTVHIKQHADPVSVDCPADVSVSTVADAAFGVVFWTAPVATEAAVRLPASHITYPQGVESGMAFPFGVTTLVVLANGTGTGVDRASDECTFTVTVTDIEKPLLDGQRYRCLEEDSPDVKPFGICDGPELSVSRHQGFATNHKYDILGAARVPPRGCCTSEDNVEHECVVVPGPHVTYGNMPPDYSPPKYCKPKR